MFTEDNRAIIPLKENKAEFILINPKRLTLGLLKGEDTQTGPNQKRCDFFILITVNLPEKILMIELKGVNIDDAIEQIKQSADFIKELFPGIKREAYVVSKRSPATTSKTQNKIYLFRKKTGIIIRFRTGRCEYKIN